MVDSYGSRATKRRRRSGKSSHQASNDQTPTPTTRFMGGQLKPLAPGDCQAIDAAARRILSHTGMSEAPELVQQTICQAGGKLSDGRLIYSEELIDRAIKGMGRASVMYGRKPGHEIHLSDLQVHVGSGGAAPYIVDLDDGRYRESTLSDLYDVARLSDQLDNIHFFSRSLVARDMPTTELLDINTAYACLAGTSKHVLVAASDAQHVQQIAEMCYLLAGSREAFLEQPFLSMNCNHAVPPLRFDAENCLVMAETAQSGIPVHANTFGQMAASSPVTMAGCLAQTTAETLAGMIFAWLINPDSIIIFGTRPMLTDLRTGAMSGGSGEQALLMAATAQMGHYYGLPNSTIAGATDSKIADAQSGYEKCLTVAMAARAGSNMITQACGMHASLMSAALESYVIDNDMLGAILRSLSPIDVNEETLALDTIDRVVRGDGHFLGEPQTLQRMQTDFLYPEIADRRNFEEWQQDGSSDIRDVAREKTGQLLKQRLNQIPPDIDEVLRQKFDIRLVI